QLIERAIVTTGLPSVSVPVLSKANARTLASASRCAPPLMSTPRRAARVIALMTVTGVLMTSEQGQLMTSSASARYSQPWPSGVSQNGWSKNSGGTVATSAATPTTAGV